MDAFISPFQTKIINAINRIISTPVVSPHIFFNHSIMRKIKKIPY